MQNDIEGLVRQALDGVSATFLEDVVSHGIHNLTNDYHGNSDDDYDAFASEFRAQAEVLLADISK